MMEIVTAGEQLSGAEALNVAKENLRDMNNVSYHLQCVATILLADKVT